MKLPAVEGLRIARTNRSVENVMERLRALAREKGLTEFAHIDFSADAARSGLGLPPTAMLILGDPKSGTPLMISARTVAIDLPLKVLAWSDAEATFVAYNEPDYLQKRHGFAPDLAQNIAGLATLVVKAAGD